MNETCGNESPAESGQKEPVWSDERAEEFVRAMDRIRKAVEETRPQFMSALQGIADTLREMVPALQKIVEQAPSPVTAPGNPNVCPAVLHLGSRATYACTMPVSHTGPHKDGDTWEITGMIRAVCGAVRESGAYDEFPCVLRPGHPGRHEDRDEDNFNI